MFVTLDIHNPWFVGTRQTGDGYAIFVKLLAQLSRHALRTRLEEGGEKGVEEEEEEEKAREIRHRRTNFM